MPGPQLQTQAFVLAKQSSGSDSFEQLTVFSGEHGVLHCLSRTPKPSPAAAGRRSSAKRSEGSLDLFDEAELWLESTNQGRTWFIKEHRFIQRQPGIGRSYETLRAASALTTLTSRNPVADESRPAGTSASSRGCMRCTPANIRFAICPSGSFPRPLMRIT